MNVEILGLKREIEEKDKEIEILDPMNTRGVSLEQLKIRANFLEEKVHDFDKA